jgi:hypothetical protein
MSGHTEGPWSVAAKIEAVNISGHLHEVWLIEDKVTGVAFVILPHENANDETRSERTATAHVVAAAPDLLEALKAWKEYESGPSNHAWSELQMMIDAAIEKAEPK